MDKIEPTYESACRKKMQTPEKVSPMQPPSPAKDKRGESSEYIIPETTKKSSENERPPQYVLPTSAPLPSSCFTERGYLHPPLPPAPYRYGSTESSAPIFPKYPRAFSSISDDYAKPGWKMWQKVTLIVVLVFILIYSTSAFIVVMLQSKQITTAITDSRCSAIGGSCISTLAERCDGGILLPKYCAGTGIIQCCLKSTRCSDRGGTCMQKSANTCKPGYYFKKGFCPGNHDIACCIKASVCSAGNGKCLDTKEQECTGGVFVPGICSGVPKIQCCFEAKECMNRRGKCQDIRNTTCSDGSYKRYICPGGNNIQCCRQV